ncbi:MAG: alpha-ribazole phosphatase [Parcubacteria group bacterium Gr01-1014_8]|nr:MAG: alpha-ribazole phosphatase [Parcubacteria group bacterium Gr01-1014_8]
MKTIYFVRHGETEGNKGHFFQGPDTPLTDKGRAQAAFIAERVSKLPIEVILSSEMERAKDTAEHISRSTGKLVEFSKFLFERRIPSVQVGSRHNSEEMRHVSREVIANFGKPGGRYSDEENFDDLKERARDALNELAERPENHIVAVTHGFFLRVILAYALFDEKLTPEICVAFLKGGRVANTGLTILRYKHEDHEYFGNSENGWEFWVWNDHAHLG